MSIARKTRRRNLKIRVATQTVMIVTAALTQALVPPPVLLALLVPPAETAVAATMMRRVDPTRPVLVVENKR